MDFGGGSSWAYLVSYADGENAAFQMNSFNLNVITDSTSSTSRLSKQTEQVLVHEVKSNVGIFQCD